MKIIHKQKRRVLLNLLPALLKNYIILKTMALCITEGACYTKRKEKIMEKRLLTAILIGLMAGTINLSIRGRYFRYPGNTANRITGHILR